MMRRYICFPVCACLFPAALGASFAQTRAEKADKYVQRIAALAQRVSGGDMDTRRTTAKLLRGMGEPVLQYLEAELKSSSPQRRSSAVFVLGEIGNPASMPPLVSAIQDGDPGVRAAAAAALGKLGEKKSAAMIAPLLTDRDETVRAESVRVIGELRAVELREQVERMLFDPSETVRLSAIQAVGGMGDRAAAAVLVKFLDSPSAKIRNKSIVALGMIGDPGVIPSVRKALGDGDPWVRASAATALGEMGDRDSSAALERAAADKVSYVRGAAAAALGAVKAGSAISCLCALLDDHAPSGFCMLDPYRETEVREEAAAALCSIAGEERPFPKSGSPAEREAAILKWSEWCAVKLAVPTPGASEPINKTSSTPAPRSR